MVRLNGKIVRLNRFPDGTLNVKVSFEDDMYQAVITWNYEGDEEFLLVAYLAMHCRSHGYQIILDLPYIPNARMDRVKNHTDVFSLKHFAALLNALDFDQVNVIDPHSAVSEALIEQLRVYSSNAMFDKAYSEISHLSNQLPIVVYPDEGAMKRYNLAGTHPYAFCVKNRNWETGKIESLDVFGVSAENLKDRTVIIRDDICSYGGTFYHTAKKLKELGVGDIYLFVTHCEPSIHYGNFDGKSLLETGLIKHVYTTDSIYLLEPSEMFTIYQSCGV